MAAIIAQISLQAANRRRDQTKRIPIDKSNVKLPSFDTHFDPQKHNAYTMRRNKYLCRVMSVRNWHNKVVGHIISEGGGYSEEDNMPSKCSKLGEMCLISTCLCLIPLFMIGLEVLFLFQLAETE